MVRIHVPSGTQALSLVAACPPAVNRRFVESGKMPVKDYILRVNWASFRYQVPGTVLVPGSRYGYRVPGTLI